ncbi:MAG: SIS domain-containing protein [Acidilobaceae archaeon]
MALELLSSYNMWPELLAEGYEEGRSKASNLKLEETPRSIIVCGLGGSGVVGDFLRALSIVYGFKVPVNVIKDYRLQPWVEESLIVTVSYSGETLETLKCFKEAVERGAKIAVITSGGRLEYEASKIGAPIVKARAGLLPRVALPSMLGGLIGLTDSIGASSVDHERVLEAYHELRNVTVDEAEPYASLVSESDITIIGACGPHSIVAERWRQELSENSKILAKTELYPESAHNDIVAWQTKKNIRTAFIAVKGGDRVCEAIMNYVTEIYKRHGETLELKLGQLSLASMLKGALIAGYASAIAATTRGVDPAATPLIAGYKKMLGENLKL